MSVSALVTSVWRLLGDGLELTAKSVFRVGTGCHQRHRATRKVTRTYLFGWHKGPGIREASG